VDGRVSTFTAAGEILVSVEAASLGNFGHVLAGMTSNVCPTAGKADNQAVADQLNCYSYVLLAAARQRRLDVLRSIIVIYPSIARALSLALRAATDRLSSQDDGGEGAALLSAVFIVLRLTVFVSQAGDYIAGRDAIHVLWSRIWPDWLRLVSFSMESTCKNGVSPDKDLKHPLIGQPLRAVTHAVLLDTILFLSATRSSILSDCRDSLVSTLHDLKSEIVGISGKKAKAVQAVKISRAGGVYRMPEASLTTLKGDMIAAERLRSLRAVS
jgi:hypothetical protein